MAPVANVLRGAADTLNGTPRGPVILCLLNPDLPGEVEMDLKAEFPVNPQIKGALKSLDGVMTVEEF